MSVGRRTKRLLVVARFAVSAALLFVVGRVLDVGEVSARLGELNAAWVVLALGVSVLQIVALAWRWRYTAARLGVDLPMGMAVGEYYLGVLLNQILPGGVTGDVTRAWRHARTTAPTGPAVRAVILERASGQVVMTSVAILSLLILPVASVQVRSGAAVVVALVLAMLLGVGFRASGEGPARGAFWSDTRAALLARDAWPIQLLSGVLVVGSYIAVYLVAARAVGVETPFARLLPLVAPVLMTMLVPVTVAGWGIREAAAAALWGLVGLTPEEGVAISVAYGLIVLASSAPGVAIVIWTLIEGRGRTGHPAPAGSDDTKA